MFVISFGFWFDRVLKYLKYFNLSMPIGVGRLRILGGGQDLEYWGGGGGQGGAKFPVGTWRRSDVNAT